MAITNAQQYQQLVNKPASGKRPGYRGSDMAEVGTDGKQGGVGSNTGAKDTSGADYGGGNQGGGSNNYDQPTGQEIRDARTKFEEGVGISNLNTLYEDGVPKLTFPGFLAAGLNLATPVRNKGLRKNIDYFKQNFSGPYTLDNYKEFMKDRRDQFTDDDDDDNNEYIPLMAQAPSNMDQETEVEQEEPFERSFRLLADGGMPEDAPVYEGGIMDLETSRQMYGLGKLVKKITRGVKKIAKSPIGKAALLYAGGTYLGGLNAFNGSGTFMANLKSGQGIGNLFNFGKNKLFGELITGGNAAKGAGYMKKGLLSNKALMGIGIPTALSYFMTPEEEEEKKLYAGADIDNVDTIINNPRDYINPRLMAEGGSTEEKEPVAKKVMPLLDMEGQEKDYRETGGFVDMGRMEKADDVPARLSKNEFVFTADAVRNAGDGSVDKGAEVMYNMMKNLESGGDVSEESQGLEGARDMFKTSQRLEEVL